jgi:cytochrome c551/c552
MRRRRPLLPALLLVALMSGSLESADADSEDSVSFLSRYWQRPLATQGVPPEHLDAGTASLSPESCGECHPLQLGDWRASRHALAMGPGVAGQLAAMAPEARQAHQGCLRCHAPLAEQAESLAEALSTGGPGQPGGLHEQGLTCAGCHLRDYRWYGPARRDGSAPPASGSVLPHDGWRSSPAFEDSRFCGACHQFQADGFALNGKLLENTYVEWQQSEFAGRGISCQSCHMPDRRHLWKGIHDKDMVASAVTISTSAATLREGMVSASLSIRNTGAGHYFPTYVTPRVVIEFFQVDAEGGVLDDTLREEIVARKVPLDLSRETFDTRIAPGETRTLRYRHSLVPKATGLGTRVRVEPDAFYRDFFTALLSSERADNERRLLERALAEAERSPFIIYEKTLPLGEGE